MTEVNADGFAFIEGTATGIPVDELRVVEPPRDVPTERPPPPQIRRQPGMNQDVFTLEEGDVVLQWPASLSPESFEDFKDWLDLMARKVGRAVKEAAPPGPDSAAESPEAA